VGLKHKPILRAIKAAGFTGLALGLLGCAAQNVAPSVESQTETLQTVKLSANKSGATNSESVDISNTTAAEFNPDSFKTEGKSTKVIETPSGPREIYDPLQDDEVRAAFKWLYEQNNSKFTVYYTEDERKYDYLPRKYRAPSQLLKSAMFAQVYAYQALSCRRVETSDCNTSFSDYKCERGQSCKYSTITIGPGMRRCLVENRRAYNISWLRIGKYSSENWPHLTQEEQLKNLFFVNCKSYGE